MHKGDALREVVAETDAGGVVFAGDDLGDLEAFEAVRTLRRQGLPTLLVCSGSVDAEDLQVLADVADVVVPGPEGVLDLLRRSRRRPPARIRRRYVPYRPNVKNRGQPGRGDRELALGRGRGVPGERDSHMRESFGNPWSRLRIPAVGVIMAMLLSLTATTAQALPSSSAATGHAAAAARAASAPVLNNESASSSRASSARSATAAR